MEDRWFTDPPAPSADQSGRRLDWVMVVLICIVAAGIASHAFSDQSWLRIYHEVQGR